MRGAETAAGQRSDPRATSALAIVRDDTVVKRCSNATALVRGLGLMFCRLMTEEIDATHHSLWSLRLFTSQPERE